VGGRATIRGDSDSHDRDWCGGEMAVIAGSWGEDGRDQGEGDRCDGGRRRELHPRPLLLVAGEVGEAIAFLVFTFC